MKPGSYRTRHTLRNAVEEITVFEPVQEILVQAVFADAKGKFEQRQKFVRDTAEGLRAKHVRMELIGPHRIGRDTEDQQDFSFQLEADGETVVLAAGDNQQRYEWCDALQRRKGALAKAHGFGRNGAVRDWEALPQQRACG
eukprot:COSAG06_NODE_37465_length_435_cov_0.508929_1_plen_140_part_10